MCMYRFTYRTLFDFDYTGDVNSTGWGHLVVFHSHHCFLVHSKSCSIPNCGPEEHTNWVCWWSGRPNGDFLWNSGCWLHYGLLSSKYTFTFSTTFYSSSLTPIILSVSSHYDFYFCEKLVLFLLSLPHSFSAYGKCNCASIKCILGNYYTIFWHKFSYKFTLDYT